MFPSQVLLITCMMSAIILQYSEGYSSCQEIYQSNNRNPSGEYTVYHSNKSIRVYCSFEESWGYTYISKASYGTAVIMSKLYSTRKFAKTRIRWSSGIQKEVSVENLLSYQNSSTLYFGYNSFTSYKGPRRSTLNIMSPYIFLGFLPLSLATNNNTQGYRTAGVDYTFKNCDRNPNSYITFYYNPNNANPGRKGSSNTFMKGWIDRSSSLTSSKNMGADFYFDWEMQMGGCGGFMTSQAVSNIGAALGLPFAISPCDGVNCQNGGNCVSSESTYTCSCVNNYHGDRCQNHPENSTGYFNSCQEPDKRVVLLSLGIFSSEKLPCAVMCAQLNTCVVFKYHNQDKRCELLTFGTDLLIDDPKPTEAGWIYYTESYAGKKTCDGCFFCH
ncbi:uncharacterized protein LOC127700100 [Mytilus californianus]|uniref:uncharacterized protein LOC127700100 n=1 Tax=Mytilus californianus TaxID=6549 RepID=UPI002247396D|nr:uncharacterized protein LOC127700100 [Mytilus californianus]